MALSASFKSLGVPPEIANMAEKASDIVKVKAIQKMVGWGGKVQNKMQTYPPSRSDYRRTGRLGSGWSQKVDADSVTVYNDVEYAPYVEGDEQRGYHGANGWPKLSRVAADEWDKTVALLRDLFQEIT